jgi:hypothetical protein
MAMANLKSQVCMKNGEESGPDREPNGSLTPLLRSSMYSVPAYQARCLKREAGFAAFADCLWAYSTFVSVLIEWYRQSGIAESVTWCAF